jgi:RNA polymerase sigma-70 factor (ECF subfamily)
MDHIADNSGRATVTATEALATEPTDDELVAAVCAGDEAAFALLFERHRRWVTRLAYRFFYRREQVEEIVQESFTTAYFALSTYRGGEERSFLAWLSRITVNTCYDELRRSTRRACIALSDLSEAEAALLAERLRDSGKERDIESATISRDLANKLLQRLAPDDRLALILLELAGLSVAEIAELTGWSVPKVKTRLYRARAALRRLLRKFL